MAPPIVDLLLESRFGVPPTNDGSKALPPLPRASPSVNRIAVRPPGNRATIFPSDTVVVSSLAVVLEATGSADSSTDGATVDMERRDKVLAVDWNRRKETELGLVHAVATRVEEMALPSKAAAE